MLGLVYEHEDFEMNAELNRKPVKLIEDRCYVLPRSGMGEEPSCRVLDVLQSVYRFGWETSKKGIAVIKSGGDKSMDEGLCRGEVERGAEFGDGFKMKKCCFGKMLYV